MPRLPASAWTVNRKGHSARFEDAIARANSMAMVKLTRPLRVGTAIMTCGLRPGWMDSRTERRAAMLTTGAGADLGNNGFIIAGGWRAGTAAHRCYASWRRSRTTVCGWRGTRRCGAD